MSSPDSSSAQRRGNRERVVRALRERGALSRSALAEVGLSRSTVSSVTEELLASGMIQEVIGGKDTRRTGRPPTLVALNGSLGLTVGIEIANGVVRAAVCSTAQDLLSYDSVPVDDHTPPESTVKTAGALIDHMLARIGRSRAEVIGAGIAMPGPIQRRSGVNGRATTLKPWVNVNPRTMAEQILGLPLLV